MFESLEYNFLCKEHGEYRAATRLKKLLNSIQTASSKSERILCDGLRVPCTFTECYANAITVRTNILSNCDATVKPRIGVM